jgi:uncharacterized protein YxjI
MGKLIAFTKSLSNPRPQYKIKLHSNGLYTIQKRFLFIFWKKNWYVRVEDGRNNLYYDTYTQPFLGILEQFNKYA